MSERAIRTRSHDPAQIRPWGIGALHALPADDSPPVDPGVASEALLLDAEATLLRARQEAQALRDRAREEADALREEAQVQGRRQGWEEGLSRAEADAEERRQPLLALLEDLPAAWERFCLAQVPVLGQIVVEAAEKVLHEQLTLEPERVTAIVRAALSHTTDPQPMVVHLHPDDLPLVREWDLRDGKPSAPLRLEPDPQIRRGGCRIEGRQGVVDATIDGGISRLADTLTGGRG